MSRGAFCVVWCHLWWLVATTDSEYHLRWKCCALGSRSRLVIFGHGMAVSTHLIHHTTTEGLKSILIDYLVSKSATNASIWRKHILPWLYSVVNILLKEFYAENYYETVKIPSCVQIMWWALFKTTRCNLRQVRSGHSARCFIRTESNIWFYFITVLLNRSLDYLILLM